MMAKLGSFDDLPLNAQKFLTDYRARLEMMSEAESTVLAVRESTALITARWAAWARHRNRKLANQRQREVVRFQRPTKPRPSSGDRARCGLARRPEIRIGFPDFCSMVALIVGFKFLAH